MFSVIGLWIVWDHFFSQNVRYNYCLVLCDSTSRWPSAYPLHLLSAKYVRDALLT